MTDISGSSSAAEKEVVGSIFSPENLAATIEAFSKEEADSIAASSVEIDDEEGEQDIPGTPSKTDAEKEEEKKAAGAVTPTDNPEGAKKLAGRFNSPEDLEKGYLELEKKFSSTRPVQAESNTQNGGTQPPIVDSQQQQEPVIIEKKTHSENGFPLDEFGLEVKPTKYWNEQRLSEWQDWYEKNGSDPVSAAAQASISLSEEYRQYSQEYANGRQKAVEQHLQAEEQEVKRLIPEQEKEVASVQTQLRGVLATLMPEEAATAATTRIFERAYSLVDSAFQQKIITRSQAASPKMVRQAVGEVLKSAVIDGSLADLLGPGTKAAAKPVDIPMAGNGNGKNGVKEPQALSGGGDTPNGGGSGTSKAKLVITPEARAYAKAFNIKPEEAQAAMEDIKNGK